MYTLYVDRERSIHIPKVMPNFLLVFSSIAYIATVCERHHKTTNFKLVFTGVRPTLLYVFILRYLVQSIYNLFGGSTIFFAHVCHSHRVCVSQIERDYIIFVAIVQSNYNVRLCVVCNLIWLKAEALLIYTTP